MLGSSDQTTLQKVSSEPESILNKNEGNDTARLQTSTPTHSQDYESSNDSLTLQIVLPPSERKRKSKPCDINKEIEDHIRKELAKNPRKTSLTVKKVKNILKYVIGNQSVLDMVSSSMKDAGQDLEVEPTLTRSKARQLRQENQIIWPLSPIQQPKPVDNEHLVLIREELPEEEDDDEYRPTIADLLEQSDDESGRQSVGTPSLNVSSASKYLANFNPDLLDDVAQDSPLKIDVPLVMTEPMINFKKPVENIGQRTRSKFSLSSTPLEAIEQAFVPPDITTDMYDFHCDNQEWENFLKEFMQPLSNDTADVDEEDDPEYNVIEDEELDKEELRRDNAVTVPRSELKTLMMELLEGIEDFSSDDETAKPTPAPPPPATTAVRERSWTKDLFTDVPETVQPENSHISPPLTPASPVQPVIGLTLSQRTLLLQQLRQHVQLLTQNFLQTYQHPLFHKHSADCKKFLVQLVELGKFNPDSAVNIFNLTKAVNLTDYWENLLSTSKGSEIISFYENESNAAQIAKKWKRFHRVTFHPYLIELIMQSDIFIYPYLLPTQPFRTDNPNKLEFTNAEDHLIAIGLEQFIPYAKKYPQWYGGRQSSERIAVDLTHELILTAKTTVQILRRMRTMKNLEGNPISYYFQHGKAETAIHHVISFDVSTVLPPIKQNPSSLHSCWKQYAEDLNKEKEDS